MRELAVTIPATRLDSVLDVLAVTAPYGVLERAAGPDTIELQMRGGAGELPPVAVVERIAGVPVRTREVPDDWSQRRLLDHRPTVVAGRIALRPPWAPPPPAGLVDIVLGEGVAFGVGTHVTTEMCLDVLARLEPAGSLADVGCGNGVLAIAAALLGFAPVVAVDHSPAAIQEATDNATRNGAGVTVTQLDLLAEPPPAADHLFANVPPAVHVAVAEGLRKTPAVAVVSGFGPDAATAVAAAYARAGLTTVEDGMEAGGWAALVLRPGG